MEHINQVVIQGGLPRDVRIGTTKRGGQYAMFTVATQETWIDKTTKDQKSKTAYHSCTAWSVTPEESSFLKKSAVVRVEGKIEYSVKKDEKTGLDRHYTNIIVDSLEFIGGNSGRRSDPQPSQENESAPQPVDDDTLPF